MKYILIVLMLVMFGCIPNIESYEIDKAGVVCKNHGGIHTMHLVLDISVSCNDGYYEEIN